MTRKFSVSLGLAKVTIQIVVNDSGNGQGGSKEETVGPFVDAFVDFREKVRVAAKAKSGPGDFLKQCDEVKDETLANSITENGSREED